MRRVHNNPAQFRDEQPEIVGPTGRARGHTEAHGGAESSREGCPARKGWPRPLAGPRRPCRAGSGTAHLQFALPLQEAVVQQVSVSHRARHLLQEGRCPVLAADAAQQVLLQLQHGQLLFQAGALQQGRLGRETGGH